MIRNTFVVILLLLGFYANAQTKDDVHNSYSKGAEAYKSENYNAALKEFTNCLELCDKVGSEADEYKNKIIPIYPNLFYKTGLELYKAKKYGESISRFLKAKEVAMKYNDENVLEKVEKVLPKLYSSQGSKMLQAANYDSSISCFNSALELDPNYTKAYYGKGMAYQGLNDFDKMKEAFDALIEKADADDKNANKAKEKLKIHYTNNGKQALADEDFEGAIENLMASLDYEDQDLEIYYFIAYANNKLEKFEATIEISKRANEIAGDNKTERLSDINFEMGEAALAIGDNTTACDAYGKVTMGSKVEKAKYQSENILHCGQ